MSYPPPQPDPNQQQPAYPPQQPYAQPGQPQYPPMGYQQPPAAAYQQTRTVTTGGLPTWMHVLYGTLGWIPCFIGWVIWPIHWWFAKSKSVSHTASSTYQPPPVYPQQQQQQPYPPPGQQYPPQQR